MLAKRHRLESRIVFHVRHRATCQWLLVAIAVLLAGADWAQFRGPSGNAVAPSRVPTRWDESQNVAWKADLPGRGPSSPIVVNGRVIVTSSSGPLQGRLHVICLDAESGKLRWQRQFWATGRTVTHPTSSVAAATPASDGQSVFAFFSSNDLVCLDLDGNLRWYRGLTHDYPKAGNDIGMSSSPVVYGDTVVVQIENQGDSFACALDSNSGETRWRVVRDSVANWASPLILPGSGERKDLVLLQSPGGLTGHELLTGEVVWQFEERFDTVPSSVAVGNRVFLPSDGMKAVEFSDNSYSPEVLWESGTIKANGPSPVYHDGRLYALSSSILTCGDSETGKVLWKLRLQGGRHWATPVIAGNLIYCVNQDGEMRVIKPADKKGEIISTNRFGETIQGTPAVADGAMYVRSDAHLWKIAEQRAK